MEAPNNNIPKQILDVVDQFSPGGFFLMTFDGSGNPKLYSKYDSRIHSAAMQYYLAKWVEATENINSDNITNSLMDRNDEEES